MVYTRTYLYLDISSLFILNYLCLYIYLYYFSIDFCHLHDSVPQQPWEVWSWASCAPQGKRLKLCYSRSSSLRTRSMYPRRRHLIDQKRGLQGGRVWYRERKKRKKRKKYQKWLVKLVNAPRRITHPVG